MSYTNGSEVEREMTRNQRGLVDTCFEEGQYESGIAMLELLRSTTFKPPSSVFAGWSATILTVSLSTRQ